VLSESGCKSTLTFFYVQDEPEVFSNFSRYLPVTDFHSAHSWPL